MSNENDLIKQLQDQYMMLRKQKNTASLKVYMHNYLVENNAINPNTSSDDLDPNIFGKTLMQNLYFEKKEVVNIINRIKAEVVANTNKEIQEKQYCEQLCASITRNFPDLECSVTYNEKSTPEFHIKKVIKPKSTQQTNLKNNSENKDGNNKNSAPSWWREKKKKEKLEKHFKEVIKKSSKYYNDNKHRHNPFFETFHKQILLYQKGKYIGLPEKVVRHSKALKIKKEDFADVLRDIKNNLEFTPEDYIAYGRSDIIKLNKNLKEEQIKNLYKPEPEDIANMDFFPLARGDYFSKESTKSAKKKANENKEVKDNANNAIKRFREILNIVNQEPETVGDQIAKDNFLTNFSVEDITQLAVNGDDKITSELEDAFKMSAKSYNKGFHEFCNITSYGETALIEVLPHWTINESNPYVNRAEDDTDKYAISLYETLEVVTSINKDRMHYVPLEKEPGKPQKADVLAGQNYVDMVTFDTFFKDGKVRYFKTGKNGELKKIFDDEANMVYNALLKDYHYNWRKLIKDLKDKDNEESDRFIQLSQFVNAAKKGKLLKVINHKLTEVDIKTEEDAIELEEQIKGYNIALKAWEDEYGKFAQTLKDDILQAKKEAYGDFRDGVNYLRQKLKLQAKEELAKLDEDKIDLICSESIAKTLKSLNRIKNEYGVITPVSAQNIRGMENLFNSYPNMLYEVVSDGVYYDSNGEMNEVSINKQVSDVTLKKQLSSYTVNVGEVAPNETVVSTTVRKSSLKPLVIPEYYLKNYLVCKFYGAVVAATFFQLLVSNTPIDEEYDYYERRKVTSAGKIKKYTAEEIIPLDNKHTAKVRIAKLREEFADELWNGSKEKVYFIKRHHTPDSDTVRDCWEFKYKGKVFKPTDSCFADLKLFDQKADMNSVFIIASIFMDKTKKSHVKSHGFSYKNTNKRWEQLEYGGYIADDSDTRERVGSKYGFKHGIKGHFTFQAPFGWLRLIEAQWNMLTESGFEINMLDKFLNNQGFKADEVGKEYIDILKKIEPSLGTRNYDLQNFVTIEEW